MRDVCGRGGKVGVRGVCVSQGVGVRDGGLSDCVGVRDGGTVVVCGGLGASICTQV